MIDYKISPGTAGNNDLPERYDDLPSHNIEVFQSENIQNILDAKSSKEDIVEIDYEIRKLTPEERGNLKHKLGSGFFSTLRKSFAESKAADIKEQIRRVDLALNNETKWFSLIIKEKNTTGLTGDETGQVHPSKFNALMRAVNRSEKDGVLGGTFGKGSSVYTFSSGLWLWFAYSVLETESNNSKVRFMGRGLVAPFVDFDRKRSYHGPLWYAREEDGGEEDRHQGLPFVNEAAHQEAYDFGIPKRKNSENGTTYLIPVFWPSDYDVDDMSQTNLRKNLVNEIIKRWFPTIYKGDLICRVNIRGENSITVDKDFLKTIPELKYKLDILDYYYGDIKENRNFREDSFEVRLPKLKSDYWEKYPFAKKSGTVQADLVLRIIKDDESFKGFLDHEDAGTTNRVALTRNKGMVVNHYPWLDITKLSSITGEVRFEGMLFAGRMLRNKSNNADHAELFLGFSENPAHNEWIDNPIHKNRCHLERFEAKGANPYNRVRQVYRMIETIIIKLFPKDDKPPIKEEICSFWKNLYRIPNSGDSSGGKSNYTYRLIEEGFNSFGEYRWKFKFESKEDSERIKLKFVPYLLTREGPMRSSEDFERIGVKEYKDLKVLVDDILVEEVFLGREDGLSRIVEVKTCRMSGNNSFHNLTPSLEIVDSIN